MGQIEYTSSSGIPHQSFEEEFLTHPKQSEWWYATGYLEAEDGHLFSYQYTLAHVSLHGFKFHMQLCGLTDFATGLHLFDHPVTVFGRGVEATGSRTAFKDLAEMTYTPNEYSSKGRMKLTMAGKRFRLALDLNAVKPPVWQCEDGKLLMGNYGDPKQTTYYFTFTNLATTGTITLDGKPYKVKGKSWFDKQGGTYTITNRLTHWEWFSLRFFDNEEVMLFSFPQHGYKDGTFIAKDGAYCRLNQYTIEPMGYTEAGGYKFSNGWKVTMPGVKEEEYTITPLMEGQFSLFIFELLAGIRNGKGELVGYCVTELLPGVLNEKLDNLRMFRRA